MSKNIPSVINYNNNTIYTDIFEDNDFICLRHHLKYIKSRYEKCYSIKFLNRFLKNLVSCL